MGAAIISVPVIVSHDYLRFVRHQFSGLFDSGIILSKVVHDKDILPG